jgi:hypothetical protein
LSVRSRLVVTVCTGIAVMRKSFVSQFHSESLARHPNVAMNGEPELTIWLTLNASDWLSAE